MWNTCGTLVEPVWNREPRYFNFTFKFNTKKRVFACSDRQQTHVATGGLATDGARNMYAKGTVDRQQALEELKHNYVEIAVKLDPDQVMWDVEDEEEPR